MTSKTGKSLQEKLERTLEDKDFYQALQIYKTLYVRSISSSNVSGAEELLVKGASTLLEHNQVKNIFNLIIWIAFQSNKQVEAATELCTMLFKHFIDQGCKLEKRTIDIVIALFRKYPVTLDGQKRKYIGLTEKYSFQLKSF